MTDMKPSEPIVSPSESINTSSLEEKNQVDDKLISNENLEKNKAKKKKGTFKKYFRMFVNWTTLQLVLSHHPLCDVFDSHVIKIGPLRLCKGCLFGYTPAYTIILMFIFWTRAQSFFNTAGLWISNLWWFTVAFAILTIGGYLIGKFSIFIKDLSKIGRGAFSGFLVVIVISQAWYFKLVAALILIGGMIFLSFKRGKEMETTCENCSWHAQYSTCPGWKGLTAYMEEPANDSAGQQRNDEPTGSNQKDNLKAFES